VWRISEDDIRMAVMDKYPDLPKHRVEQIVERAHLAFSIPDWQDYVVDFARVVLEDA